MEEIQNIQDSAPKSDQRGSMTEKVGIVTSTKMDKTIVVSGDA